jgi:dUTP pyrophosphatase
MLNVKIINNSPFELPEYQTFGSAGMDLRADLSKMPNKIISLPPLARVLVPTGLYIAVPQGYEAQIRPRSGLALKKGLSIPNAPGTIDSDYRGEVGVILVNLSDQEIIISHGERIAQMVVARYERVQWLPTDTLDETIRGAGGFGSTSEIKN